eukprot:CAMPEP_0202347512 /NCGR_PEP_ID=MMETSP1126-20121109/5841_1 /ASSEMBLY_ACC=CAM_ASM_000457 /TAXON_ID=3047 /ORGANISM="Dunaliella tertiolecta, Strain CCMP1320" /LENGTH=112 /DNA_ID=CAMNT_0048939071 /DNA_START=387 /DNA_END=725 /DNA_ORIENTATION=-
MVCNDDQRTLIPLLTALPAACCPVWPLHPGGSSFLQQLLHQLHLFVAQLRWPFGGGAAVNVEPEPLEQLQALPTQHALARALWPSRPGSRYGPSSTHLPAAKLASAHAWLST